MEPQIRRTVRGLVKAMLIFVTVIVVMGCLKVLETPQALKQTLMRSK